jgi:TetR/AcrR family transcriptional regulator, fatty acid metabolism regulator protein
MAISADERRRQILDAAVRVFARAGYAGCRIADVAEEAGVAYGLVYHYFASKDALLEAISAETWQAVTDAVSRAREREVTGRGRLSYVTHFLLTAWERQPDLVRVLIREVSRAPRRDGLAADAGRAFAAIEAVVAEAQATGEFRRDVQPALAAIVYFGAVDELLTRVVAGEAPGPVADAERALVAVVADGLSGR